MLCPDMSFCNWYAASICVLLMYSLVSVLFQASPSTPADQVKQWMLVKSWLPLFSTKWCGTLKTPDGNLASVHMLFWMRVPLSFKRGRSVDHSSRRGLVARIRNTENANGFTWYVLTLPPLLHCFWSFLPASFILVPSTRRPVEHHPRLSIARRDESDMAATFTSSGPPFLPRRLSDPPTKRAGRS